MVQSDDEAERVLWCGNLHEKVTEEILYELFLQAGPLEKVKIVSSSGPRYAFVTFQHRMSVPYTISLMNNIRLFDRPLRLQVRTGSSSGSTPALSALGSPTPAGRGGVMGIPPPAPVPLLPPAHIRHSVPMQQSSWVRGVATPVAAGSFRTPDVTFLQQQHQHASFHRSASEPDSLGVMRNGRRLANGVAAVAGDSRAPYARPNVLCREFSEPSPVLVAQLRAVREMAAANQSRSPYSDSGWGSSSSGRHGQYSSSRNSGGNPRSYR